MASTKPRIPINQDQKSIKKALDNLLAQPANKTCFDCPQRFPTFANLTIGSFVCARCSGLLREFNHRVKSFTASSFTKEDLQLLSGGNDAAATYWLASWTPQAYPVPSIHDDQSIKQFMIVKYSTRRYYKSSVNSAPAATAVSTPPTSAPGTPNLFMNPSLGSSLPPPASRANSVPAGQSFFQSPAPAPALVDLFSSQPSALSAPTSSSTLSFNHPFGTPAASELGSTPAPAPADDDDFGDFQTGSVTDAPAASKPTTDFDLIGRTPSTNQSPPAFGYPRSSPQATPASLPVTANPLVMSRTPSEQAALYQNQRHSLIQSLLSTMSGSVSESNGKSNSSNSNSHSSAAGFADFAAFNSSGPSRTSNTGSNIAGPGHSHAQSAAVAPLIPSDASIPSGSLGFYSTPTPLAANGTGTGRIQGTGQANQGFANFGAAALSSTPMTPVASPPPFVASFSKAPASAAAATAPATAPAASSKDDPYSAFRELSLRDQVQLDGHGHGFYVDDKANKLAQEAKNDMHFQGLFNMAKASTPSKPKTTALPGSQSFPGLAPKPANGGFDDLFDFAGPTVQPANTSSALASTSMSKPSGGVDDLLGLF
ncbi:uncharacterized protein BJ171DRAFT_514385 [Polychytrium aggregatum]|uniref:uncharacterized protein n=1 Tax=Polychytrium aggregatum TaxID=110093 RepID=UPI0022FDEE2A|nr:uncharacterized protein BJ171DRAFT_514385 [Polychytrium aggregatum]KAI9202482.1 hypothetical protein BJ171DRAFT_514385 [Polychytrium aggregatum]